MKKPISRTERKLVVSNSIVPKSSHASITKENAHESRLLNNYSIPNISGFQLLPFFPRPDCSQ